MSEKANGFLVVLENNISQESAEEVKNALSLIRGVVSVNTHLTDASDYIAEVRARSDVRRKIMEILFPKD